MDSSTVANFIDIVVDHTRNFDKKLSQHFVPITRSLLGQQTRVVRFLYDSIVFHMFALIELRRNTATYGKTDACLQLACEMSRSNRFLWLC